MGQPVKKDGHRPHSKDTRTPRTDGKGSNDKGKGDDRGDRNERSDRGDKGDKGDGRKGDDRGDDRGDRRGRDALMPHASLEAKHVKTAAKVRSQQRASKNLARMAQVPPSPRTGKKGSDKSPDSSLRDSQNTFSKPDQTIIVFDWDDTLFPTHWLRHEQHIHWRYPLDEQTGFSEQDIRGFKKQLGSLQNNVQRVLAQAIGLGHVVVVTLARPPWVQLSCDNFFPQIGRFLQKHKIKVVYAQDLDGDSAQDYNKQQYESDEDAGRFWIQKKQQGIMGEISNFYGSSGSSWKNIISLGDSDFERYAMQASLSDYAAHNAKGTSAGPQVGAAGKKAAVLTPSTSKSKTPDKLAVSGFVGKHYRRLRCKTIKMFDSPTVDDLTTEMSMLHKWMPYLVKRDAGFDVDLEDEAVLYQVHCELTGEELAN